MAGKNDVLMFKLVLIGDSSVGKSYFKIRTIELDGKRVGVQIWDTAGQENFRSIITAYYRNAMGIFLVYDVTNERSFHTWVSSLEQNTRKDSKKILIGSKCDCAEERVIPYEQGQQLANELDVPFFEISAKENISIDKAFYKIVSEFKSHFENWSNEQTSTRGLDESQQGVGLDLGNKGRCC